MNKFKMGKSYAVLFALALGTGGAGWAGVTSCGASPGTSLATLLSVPDNGNTPPNGCGQIDLGFNAFSVPTSTGTNAGPTTAQINLSTSGGTAGLTTTQAPIFALYTLTGGNSLGLNNNPRSIVSSFNATGSPVAGQALPSNSPDQWAVDGLGLTFTATSSANPNHIETVEVMEEFCLGQVTFSCLTTANNYGYLQITEHIATNGAVTYTDILCTPGVGGCTQTTPTTAALSIAFGPVIPVATQLTIDLNRPGGSGNTLTLSSFQETWDQIEIAPEPSTFILFGSALAGLGVYGFRKRKRQ